jgi:hypothetical protein
MPYLHIEELGDRSQERFALGLSAQNVIGMVVCGFPLFTISSTWPPGARLAAILAALALGFIATVEVSGLLVYAWPLWWARGRVRRLVQSSTIYPDQLPGIAAERVAAPLRAGGPLRVARRRRPACLPASRTAHSAQPLADAHRPSDRLVAAEGLPQHNNAHL